MLSITLLDIYHWWNYRSWPVPRVLFSFGAGLYDPAELRPGTAHTLGLKRAQRRLPVDSYCRRRDTGEDGLTGSGALNHIMTWLRQEFCLAFKMFPSQTAADRFRVLMPSPSSHLHQISQKLTLSFYCSIYFCSWCDWSSSRNKPGPRWVQGKGFYYITFSLHTISMTSFMIVQRTLHLFINSCDKHLVITAF